jgi:putative sterol carrier protein
MSEIVIAEFMNRIPEAFIPEKAEGLNAVIQFSLTGTQGGNWFVTIQNKTCTVTEGQFASPRLTLKADSQDAVDVLTGKLDGTRAYMLGKLKVMGDLGLAMRLPTLFKIG